MLDEAQLEPLVMALAATFRVEPSGPLKLGYWLGLRDLELSKIQAAVARAMISCRFMPTPREIRDLAGEVTVEQKAVLAWAAVKRAIRQHGSYRSVDFDDPTVNAAVRSLGGWPRVCGTESEELDKWTSKEFQRLYRELSGLQLNGDMTRYLLGVFEGSNDWTESVPPVRVSTGIESARETGLAVVKADR